METHLENQQNKCKDCTKNSQLIKKYQKLHKLLKKKQQRTFQQLSSKLSNGKTTSHTSQASQNIYHAFRLYHILNSIVKKKYFSFFYISQRKSAKKYLIKSIVNKIKKIQLSKGLNAIKHYNSEENLQIFQYIDQQLRFEIMKSFDKIKKQAKEKKKLSNNFEDNKESKNITNEIKKNIIQFKKDIINKKMCKNTLLTRRNIELQISNYKLSKQIEQLKLMLQESNRRLHKQNQKKRQSLQMLAEQLNQKNQIISELNGTIKKYQYNYGICNNVLDDNIFTLRKQVDYLETVRDRVQNQLKKVNHKLQLSIEKSLKLQENLNKYEKQNLKIKQKLFDLQTKESNTVILNQSLSKLIQRLKLRQSKLKVYERQMTQSLKNDFKQKPQQILSASQKIISQSKVQIILCFIENVNILEYQIPSLELFDKQQQQVIINHKISYNKLYNQVNIMSKMYQTNKKKKQNYTQFQQIQFRGRNNSGTFFGAMDSPKSSEIAKSSNIKLLQMQMQKNKQIQKISELKQKMMHIRIIILNLLKSLQIKNLKSQSESILQILFDLFQYSEEERQQVFTYKRKKFLGFI